MTHIPHCGCDVCQSVIEGKSRTEAIQEHQEREKKSVEKYGFYVRLIDGEGPYGGIYNTYMLPESFGHPDLQIVLSLDPQVAMSIINRCVDKIKSGMTFEPNKVYADVLNDYGVKFVPCFDEERKILRIIMPDAQNNLDQDVIQEGFAEQYHGV